MLVALEAIDTLDQDHAIGLDRDDRAHLLQDGDEIHDLRLDGRVLQLGGALRTHGGEKHLLGRTDARVRQLDVCTMQTVRSSDVDALEGLVHDSTEGTKGIEVEVDGAITDAATAEIGNARLTETVKQRTAEQDRDAAGSGMRVDLREVRLLNVRRVEVQRPGFRRGNDHAINFEQSAHDLDVADVWHVAQGARGFAEKGRHHGLGGQILGTAHGDATLEGVSAGDGDLVRLQTHPQSCFLGICC